jgi:hypothetical protein
MWNMYGNPNQSMDDKFFVQGIVVNSQFSIPSGISTSNHHLSILDGHGSHVNL